MSVNLSPIGGAGWQFFDNNGTPLSGGLIYTYAAGTSTPLATYTSYSGATPNSNPIVLDSAGRPPNEIWILGGLSYKFVLQNSSGNSIWTADNINGALGGESTVTATQGQTVFSVGFNYYVGANNLKVYVNGSKQVVSTNYTETTNSTITFSTGLNVGDIVEFLQ